MNNETLIYTLQERKTSSELPGGRPYGVLPSPGYVRYSPYTYVTWESDIRVLRLVSCMDGVVVWENGKFR